MLGNAAIKGISRNKISVMIQRDISPNAKNLLEKPNSWSQKSKSKSFISTMRLFSKKSSICLAVLGVSGGTQDLSLCYVGFSLVVRGLTAYGTPE